MLDLLSDSLISIGIGLIGTIGTALQSIKFVQEGERGVKVRFGRVVRDRNNDPVIVEPGFVFMIPFVDTLVRRHVRQQTIELNNQTILLQDNTVFLVDAILLFRVTDVYKALFEIEDLEASLRNYCMGILRDIVSQKYMESINNIESISNQLFTELNTIANEWGIECIQFKLTNCSPTDETAQLLIIKQTIETRVKALTNNRAGIKAIQNDINSGLASVLIGMPMVSSTYVNEAEITPTPNEEP
jgi:regulator of protease activity HflC (stomatin/prohibitin superfamily)